MINTVIFDFDGVIVDTSNLKTEVFVEFYKSFPAPASEAMVKFHFENKGLSRYAQFEHFSKEIKLPADELASQFEQKMKTHLQNVKVAPATLQLLQELASRLPLYICSNSPQAELDFLVDQNEIRDFFQQVLGSSPTSSKEKSIQTILDDAMLEGSEALYIGDTRKDYELAQKLGLEFLGLENSLSKFPEAIRKGPDLGQLFQQHFDAQTLSMRA